MGRAGDAQIGGEDRLAPVVASNLRANYFQAALAEDLRQAELFEQRPRTSRIRRAIFSSMIRKMSVRASCGEWTTWPGRRRCRVP